VEEKGPVERVEHWMEHKHEYDLGKQRRHRGFVFVAGPTRKQAEWPLAWPEDVLWLEDAATTSSGRSRSTAASRWPAPMGVNPSIWVSRAG
jgi:hypothetical protein